MKISPRNEELVAPLIGGMGERNRKR